MNGQQYLINYFDTIGTIEYCSELIMRYEIFDDNLSNKINKLFDEAVGCAIDAKFYVDNDYLRNENLRSLGVLDVDIRYQVALLEDNVP